MRNRLSKLQWAGIALSAIWFVGAFLYSYNSTKQRADDFANFSYRVCLQSVAVSKSQDTSHCDTDKASTIQTWMQGSQQNALILAAVPIPFFWLAGLCLLYFIRAQIVGFRAVLPWSSLSKWKKASVILCGGACFVGLFMLAVVEMNRYTDSVIPLSPAAKEMVITGPGGETVQAEGTWVRTDLTDDTIADPIQTSKILCVKSENKCFEGQALVSGTALIADIVEHDIQSWTNDAIIYRDDDICGSTIYSIDLNTEKVTGAGHATNRDNAYCKTNPFKGKADWSLTLSDGFPVYWAMHQKARPLPLRVFQSFFGN